MCLSVPRPRGRQVEEKAPIIEPARTATEEPESEPRRTTSVYMPVSLLDQLDELAREMRVSRTWLIEEATRDWLARRRG